MSQVSDLWYEYNIRGRIRVHGQENKYKSHVCGEYMVNTFTEKRTSVQTHEYKHITHNT